MSPKIKLSLDIYSIAGIIVLGVASIATILLVISNWSLIAVGGNRVYYLVVMLVASIVPLAMLLLYVLSIRGTRTELSSRGRDLDSDIEVSEESVANEKSISSMAKEVEIKNPAANSEQKRESVEQAQALEGRIASADNIAQIDLKGVVKEEVAKAAADLISKIDGFSQEVQGIRRELEEIRSTVESAMIDIRSLLSEISNPFNYLRRFTTETDIRELGLSVSSDLEGGFDRKTERGGSVSTVKTAQPISRSAERSDVRNNNQGSVGSVESIDAEEFSRELAEIFSKGASVSKLMRIIMFVGDNLQILGRDGLLGIVELGVSSGVIPKESMDIVAKVVSLIESTKVPPKRLAITLHKLAKSLGITDKEAEFLAMAISEG